MTELTQTKYPFTRGDLQLLDHTKRLADRCNVYSLDEVLALCGEFDLLLKRVLLSQGRDTYALLHNAWRKTTESLEERCLACGLLPLEEDRQRLEDIVMLSFFWRETLLKKQNVMPVTPVISVVMPVYQGFHYIWEALRSLYEQTYQDFEVVLVNEFENDDPLQEIVSIFGDTRTRIVDKTYPSRLGGTINAGLRAARGQYIARMDADDISHPLRLAKQVEYMQKRPEIITSATACRCFGTLQDTPSVILSSSYLKAGQTMHNYIVHSSVIMRREQVESLGLWYDESVLAEDYELWDRTLKVGKMGVLPEVLLYYRIHPKSINGQNKAPLDEWYQNHFHAERRKLFNSLSEEEYARIDFPEALDESTGITAYGAHIIWGYRFGGMHTLPALFPNEGYGKEEQIRQNIGARRLVLWGDGNFSKKLQTRLTATGWEFLITDQTFKISDSSLEGTIKVPTQTLKDMSSHYYVAVATYYYHPSIIQQLEEWGYQKGDDYLLFYAENHTYCTWMPFCERIHLLKSTGYCFTTEDMQILHRIDAAIYVWDKQPLEDTIAQYDQLDCLLKRMLLSLGEKVYPELHRTWRHATYMLLDYCVQYGMLPTEEDEQRVEDVVKQSFFWQETLLEKREAAEITPTISVVMPVYKGFRHIWEALRSIYQQTFQDFEVILVNGFENPDPLDQIVAIFEDHRTRIVDEPGRCRLGQSLNMGIAAAKGEFIARMDADDIALPQRFEKQVEFLRANPDIALCGTQYRAFGIKNNMKAMPLPQQPEEIKCAMLFGMCFCHPSLMWRREALKENGLRYDETVRVEDYELFSRAVYRVGASNLPDTLMLYRVGEHNLTQQRSHDGELYAELQNIKAQAREMLLKDLSTEERDGLKGTLSHPDIVRIFEKRLGRERLDHLVVPDETRAQDHIRQHVGDRTPVIWGYGLNGRMLEQALREMGFADTIVVDQRMQEKGMAVPAPLSMPIENLANGRGRYYVILSMVQPYPEVDRLLASWGYDPEKDYLWYYRHLEGKEDDKSNPDGGRAGHPNQPEY